MKEITRQRKELGRQFRLELGVGKYVRAYRVGKRKSLVKIVGRSLAIALTALTIITLRVKLREPFVQMVSHETLAKVSVAKTYASTERPTIELGRKSQLFEGLGEVLGVSAELKNEFEYSLQDPYGNSVPSAELIKNGEESYQIKLPDGQIVPGKYQLSVSYGEESVTREFTWGVLSVNTNKATYRVGDTAKLSMAVLDDKGHTICDAEVQLAVTSPEGKREEVSVTRSGACQGDTYTESPDYLAEYPVGEAGKYMLEFTNLSLGYAITDAFYAEKEPEFEIERKGPTRIFPEAAYNMQITVKANKGFKGIISERIPASFVVNKSTEKEGGYQILSTKVELAKGELMTISYQFDAPDVSPEMYLLGPLTVGSYQEARSWQVASDTVTTNNPSTNTGSWTNGSNAYADGTSYANITSGSPSGTHTYGGYGFSLGSDSIDQVRVRYDAYSQGGSTTQGRSGAQITGDEANTGGFTTSPLYSKMNDGSDSTLIVGVTNAGGNATFNFSAFSIPTGSTITSIQVDYRTRSTTTSTAQNTAGVIKVNGSYYRATGRAAPSSAGSITAYTDTWTQNPNTSAAWTVADINGTGAAPLQAFGVGGSDFNPDVNFYAVTAQVNYTSANNEQIRVQVSWDGGTNWSSQQTTALDNTETTYWYDVTAATAWTPTKLNDTNFKVRVDAVTVGDTGDVRLDWLPVEVTHTAPINISGTVYTDEGSNNIGANKTVNVRVNGAGSYTAETNSSGVYTVAISGLASGNVITAYLDNETEEGTTVVVSDGATKSDINIFQNRVAVRYDTGTSITPDNLYAGDDADDDIKYNVSAASNGNLTVDSGFELHVWTGMTFDASGGTVTTQGTSNLHVDDNGIAILDTATNTIAGDLVVDGGATARINASTGINGGDIVTSGTSPVVTTTSGTPTVTMSSTGTVGGGTTPTLTFHNLATSGSGVTTISDNTTVNNDVTVGAGTTLRINANLSVSGGDITTTTTGAVDYSSGTPTVTTSGAGAIGGGSGGITFYNLTTNGSSSTTTLSTNNIVIANALNVGASHVLAMGSNSITIGSGSISDSGDITMGSGASSTQSSGTVTVLSTTNAADWSGAGTFTAYNLTIGAGSGMSVDNETSDLIIDVNNDFTISTNATFNASSTASFTVGGNWSNSGTFEAGNGTVTMDAGDAGNTLAGTMTTTSAFNNLIFNNGSGSWTFNNNATVDSNFTITAATAVTAPSSLTVAGNFAGGSSFAGNSGTVTLNGASGVTQAVTGSTTFYNLSASASGNRTITFAASSTTRVTNNLTLTGTDCDSLLLLRSSSKGSSWSLDDDAGGTTSVSYVDVQDSNATDQAVSASTSSNSGGNTNWTIAASACEGASTSSTGSAYSFQRKTIYDETNGRYWMFYHDGDEIEVKYSSDTGTSWQPPTTAASGHLAYDTNDFSVWRETISTTEYVFLAVTDGYDVKILAGTLGAADITWDGDIDTVFDGTGTTDAYSYPYVALDSSDYIWVGARHLSGSDYLYKTRDSNAAGSTDLSTLSWNTAIQISNSQTDANVYGNITPLTSQDMYATFAVGTSLKGCMWDDNDGTGRWETSDGTQSCAATAGGGGESTYFDSLATNLQGYWKMNEASWNGTSGEVTDETTNNNDGTRQADATTARTGFNRAGSFDGTGDYALVPYSSTYDEAANLSVSFWFNPGVTINSGISSDKGLLSKAYSNTDADNDWTFFWNSGEAGKLRFGTYGDNVKTTTATWTAGTWYHVVATVTSTNTAYIYVNGVRDNDASDTSISSGPINGSQNGPLNIGLAKVSTGDQYFNGKIDELRFYNRTLTAEEVGKLYQLRPDSTALDDASDFGTLPSGSRQVVRTKSGTLYAFVNDGGNCEIWKSAEGVNWAQQQSGTSITCESGGTVAAAIDNNQDLHVLYQNANVVYYRNYDTATDAWDAGGEEIVYQELTGDSNDILDMAVAVDASNIPHATFVAYWISNPLAFKILYYSNRVGGSWDGTPTEVDSGATLTSRDFIDIAIGMDGKPVVSFWETSVGVQAARGSANDATSFATDIVTIDSTVSTVANTQATSIAVDTLNGKIWVSYIDSGGSIALGKHNYADAWSTWSTVTTKTGTSYEPSIAVTGEGELYVFYQDNSTDQRIAYDIYDAAATSPAWLGEVILATPPSGTDYKDVKVKWSFEWNNYGSNKLDYMFADGTDVYINNLQLRRMPRKVDDSSNFGSLPYPANQVVRTSTGTLYTSLRNGTSCEIWKSSDNGMTWAQQDSANNPTCQNSTYDTPKLAINSQGNLGVLFIGSLSSTTLSYVSFSTSTDTFGTAESVYVFDDGLGDFNLAYDSNDIPHVVMWGTTFTGSNYDCMVKYSNKVGGSWDATPPDIELQTVADCAGYYEDLVIAIDEDNLPIVAYEVPSVLDLTTAVGNTNDAASFTVYDVDTSVTDIIANQGITVGIDSAGNTWIAYLDENGTDDYVTLLKRTDGSETSSWSSSWSSAITDSKAGLRPGMVIDGANVYVIYEDDQDDIVANLYSGSSWSGEVILEEHGQLQDTAPRWSYLNNASYSTYGIDYLYSDGTDVFHNRYLIASGTTGTQDAIDTILTGVTKNLSVVADSSSNLHLVYVDDETTDQISYKKWTNASKTWGSATLVPASASANHIYPTIAVDQSTGNTDDLYVGWIDSSNSHVYYRQYDNSAVSWQTVQDWKTTGSNTYVSFNYGNDGRIFGVWARGTSPYTIDWGSITAPAAGASPTVSSVSLNGGSTITLTEGTTTEISWTATVSDTDGYDNLSTANGKVYRSGVTNAESCTPNDANCYADASCTLTSCAGNSCTATCSVNMAFFADATDTGSTYQSEYWRAWVQGVDDEAHTGSGFSSAGSPDLASTAGMDITSSITYGTLLPGDDTQSNPKTTTVTNTGNTQLDLELSGDDLCTNYPTCSGPQIGVGYQEYSTSTFTYGVGTGLTGTPTTVQLNLSKATVVPSNATSTLYWGLGVPSPKEDGSYSGANTIGVINGGS